MKARLLLAALALAVPGTASGLTLLQPDDGTDAVRVRVDRPPLSARALDGRPRLDGAAVGDELSRVEADWTRWRGFPNTTLLPVAGPGTLLLADRASGIVLHLDPPGKGSTPEPGGEPTGDANRTATPATPAGPDPDPDRDRERDESHPASAPGPEGRPDAEATDGGGFDPPGPALVLGLVAAGALGVEAWSRRSEEASADRWRGKP